MLGPQYLIAGATRRGKRWVRSAIYRCLVKSGCIQVKALPDEGSIVWQADENEWLEIPVPMSNTRVPDTLSRMCGRHRLCRACIDLVTDARVIFGVPFDNAGRLLSYGVMPANYRNVALHIPCRAFVRRVICGTSSMIQCGVSVANAWTNSYFHWLTEILPRIAMMQECGMKGFDVIAGGTMTRWQIESLRMLGIDTDRQVRVPKDVRVKRLLVPGFPRCVIEGQGFSVPSPKRLQSLREQLGIRAQGDTTGRIFISRRKAAGRHLVNEAEVLGALEALGFKAVVLEELSFPEQAELFRNASIVVGPHGAGLANIVFCRVGTVVVEIVGKFVNASFFTLAASLGLKYGLFQGTSVKRYPVTRSDIVVDPGELKEFVQSVTG